MSDAASRGEGGDRGLIYRYYLYRITTSAGFYLPVSVLILQDKGFGLGFVGFAYAVYALGTLLSEIPTGYLGDRLGRRASLALGCVLRVVVIGLYPFLESAAAFSRSTSSGPRGARSARGRRTPGSTRCWRRASTPRRSPASRAVAGRRG